VGRDTTHTRGTTLTDKQDARHNTGGWVGVVRGVRAVLAEGRPKVRKGGFTTQSDGTDPPTRPGVYAHPSSVTADCTHCVTALSENGALAELRLSKKTLHPKAGVRAVRERAG
jgi:hypothetical protein